MIQYLVKFIFILNRFSDRVVKYLIRKCEFEALLKVAYEKFDTAVLNGPINDKMRTLNYNIPVSFKNSLNTRSYRAQFNRSATPEWILNNKMLANNFADHLGFKRPSSLQKDVSYDDLNFVDNTIIKPVSGAGSKGVYKFINKSSIYNLRKGTRVTFNQMKSELKKLDKKFITEELVLSSNNKIRDYKFYCFYGEIPIILEIERFPKLQYCVWDNNLNKMYLDKYRNKDFTGIGVKKKYIDLVREMSMKIPAPFVRIDFLHSKENDQLLFGEFTPRPGSYDSLETKIDHEFGNEFVKAEVRLYNDLLNGKDFNHYKNFVNLIESNAS